MVDMPNGQAHNTMQKISLTLDRLNWNDHVQPESSQYELGVKYWASGWGFTTAPFKKILSPKFCFKGKHSAQENTITKIEDEQMQKEQKKQTCNICAVDMTLETDQL